MHNRRNYYRILNVQPDAPVEIIRSSYRTLMQELKQHPDLGGDHGNAVLINEAFTILSDFAKRAEYDRQLMAQSSDARPGFAAHPNSGQRREGQRPCPSEQPTGPHVCPFCKLPYGHGEQIHMDALCSDCESPLYAARRLQVEESDRRAIQRFAKHHAISFYTNWPQPEGHTGQTEDISHNGMKFVTQQELSKGQFLKIDCDVCLAIGEVTHCEQKRSGLKKHWMVGVVFVTLRFERPHGTFVSTTA